ncbi:MAG: amidohydrolase family protein [Caldilineaceae bacterium]
MIDAHVHIESSLCTAPLCDSTPGAWRHHRRHRPHEIANVAGVAGLRYMAAAARDLPLRVLIMAPSCVPATHMETSGATLTAANLAPLLADGTVHGLAEVMNFPGVVQGDATVLAKLAAFAGRPRDGHAPALRDKALNAYVAAGIGSEHECTTVAEAQEKLARGLYIFIREATMPTICIRCCLWSHRITAAASAFAPMTASPAICLTRAVSTTWCVRLLPLALTPSLPCAWRRSIPPSGLACLIGAPLPRSRGRSGHCR